MDQTARIPGIMISARGQENDKVVGFEEGADDIFARPEESRTVDSHMAGPRTKMGKAGDMIRKVRGFGYMVEAG